MKQRIKFHLEYAEGRGIVIWGTGDLASRVARVLSELGVEIQYFVSRDYEKLDSFCNRPVFCKDKLDKDEVYVLESTTFFSNEIRRDLEELGFENKHDFCNIYSLAQSYDWEYDGVPIGKCSHFPPNFAPYLGKNAPSSTITAIGRFTSINHTAQLSGDHNLNALSTGLFHSIIENDKHPFDESVLEIGNDVWIGANVFINISRVKSIGDGAIIGAGAVVLEDVPPFAVVVGVPAKVKKYRFTEDEIKVLQEVKWWEWSNSKIKENMDLIQNPKKFFEKYGEK